MSKIYTLAQLVKKYGSEAQKRSFKKNGNLSGKEFQLLTKSAETEWESVLVLAGRGSKRVIECSGKRPTKLKRVDNRVNNGKGQLVGEFELKSLVVNYLIQHNSNVKPMSATKWIRELDIVDISLTGALYRDRSIHLDMLHEHFGKINRDYNKDKSDIDMLEEFLHVFLKHVKSNIVSVFKKLSKNQVIDYKTETWGCTTKNTHRKLSRLEISSIEEIRRTLLSFFGLEAKDLFKSNMKEVKAFNKRFGEELDQELNLRYYYVAHYCKIKNQNSGMFEHLERLQEQGQLGFTYSLTDEEAFNTTQVYKDLQNKHSLLLAKKREKNTTNSSDTNRIKHLKVMKQYAPIWKWFLFYFKCNSCLRPKTLYHEKMLTTPNVINIKDTVLEIPEVIQNFTH
ncbi:hypothetical protein CHH58_06490 [Terribacillus saccharophilus]|uniref:hypothetical protein n=1 Tax=Terribacillus saccharophilus TaxID=361277 RepID=UPI000BA6E91E|nr:hypothetical protein [Terribacillus saccharophilus]PAF37836.1 hypothetical protein CHH58_06490 [Terribacillus saccharophilus]